MSCPAKSSDWSGPNGSGKTTAINVISGLYAPDGGEVMLDGTAIGGVASHKLVHRGINRTFQVPKPFLSLTVRQNIEVALAYGRAAVAPPTMAALLEEYRLAEVADRPAADLNNAQQKMLDLVRALATRRGCCCSTNSPPGSIRPNSTGSPSASRRWRRPAWRSSWSSI